MVRGKKIVVVLPAYNAGKTLRATFAEIPRDIVDEILLVDDGSRDETVSVARELGIQTIVHPENRGYGGNQKTCYRAALAMGADIVVMLHPDYQYTPRLISPMVFLLESGLYDVVLGSRILGGKALLGGMPLYKYVSNRLLTLTQNWLMGAKLSEYHTGYRAYTRRVLERVPFEQNSDDFVFDNQILAQIHHLGFAIAEVTCPAKYFQDASTINFAKSVQYGLGCLEVGIQYRLSKMGVIQPKIFLPKDTS